MKKKIIKSNARNEEKERGENSCSEQKQDEGKKEGRQGMKETVRSDTDRRRETWDFV